MEDVCLAVTLSEKEPLVQFVVSPDNNEEQTVVVKHIFLGAEAEQGEFNVVEVETKVNEKEIIKIPIAVLKAGETRALRPNLEFPSSLVIFKLIKGKGPVYVYGQLIVSPEGNEYDDEIDEDGDEEEINGKHG